MPGKSHEKLIDHILTEIRSLRDERRRDHEYLAKKISRIENDVSGLKARAQSWGAIAGLFMVLAVETAKRLWK